MHRMNSYITSLDDRQKQFLVRIFGFDFSVQDIRIHLNRKLLLFGLDGAGKTTLLYKLTQDEGVPVQMTMPISSTSSKSSGTVVHCKLLTLNLHLIGNKHNY